MHLVIRIAFRINKYVMLDIFLLERFSTHLYIVQWIEGVLKRTCCTAGSEIKSRFTCEIDYSLGFNSLFDQICIDQQENVYSTFQPKISLKSFSTSKGVTRTLEKFVWFYDDGYRFLAKTHPTNSIVISLP